jgi:hypothetical protein
MTSRRNTSGVGMVGGFAGLKQAVMDPVPIFQEGQSKANTAIEQLTIPAIWPNPNASTWSIPHEYVTNELEGILTEKR